MARSFSSWTGIIFLQVVIYHKSPTWKCWKAQPHRHPSTVPHGHTSSDPTLVGRDQAWKSGLVVEVSCLQIYILIASHVFYWSCSKGLTNLQIIFTQKDFWSRLRFTVPFIPARDPSSAYPHSMELTHCFSLELFPLSGHALSYKQTEGSRYYSFSFLCDSFGVSQLCNK